MQFSTKIKIETRLPVGQRYLSPYFLRGTKSNGVNKATLMSGLKSPLANSSGSKGAFGQPISRLVFSPGNAAVVDLPPGLCPGPNDALLFMPSVITNNRVNNGVGDSVLLQRAQVTQTKSGCFAERAGCSENGRFLFVSSPAYLLSEEDGTENIN